MHTNKIKSVTVLSLITMVILVLSGCDGCKKDADDIIDVAVDEYLFGGFYKSGLGPTIEVDGDEAVIVDFGYSDLGDNPAVINTGAPYIKNIEKVGVNKYEGDIVQRVNDNTGKLKSVSYAHTEISVSDGAFNLSVYDSPYSSFVETKDPGAGSGGGGNNGGNCYEGTWYSTACGDSKGVIWKFNSDKTGSFSNKDCNGICTPMVFTFTYSVSGNTITCKYDDIQPIVKCTGYQDSRPPKPSKDGVFTFECQGNKLLVNSGNGPNTFTR